MIRPFLCLLPWPRGGILPPTHEIRRMPAEGDHRGRISGPGCLLHRESIMPQLLRLDEGQHLGIELEGVRLHQTM